MQTAEQNFMQNQSRVLTKKYLFCTKVKLKNVGEDIINCKIPCIPYLRVRYINFYNPKLNDKKYFFCKQLW